MAGAWEARCSSLTDLGLWSCPPRVACRRCTDLGSSRRWWPHGVWASWSETPSGLCRPGVARHPNDRYGRLCAALMPRAGARMILVLVIGFWTFLRALLFGSAAIALENLALRHQLAVLQRCVGRPRLAGWDRVLWVWLSRLWAGWRPSLVIVQPATVLA